RSQILADCRRPRFAEAALYSKPIGGGKVEGPSIRFVESALRHYGNVDIQTPAIYDDADKRIVRVCITDLETNVSYSKDVTIPKTVERRFLKKGQKAISQRMNSNSQVVYTVAATDDDILNKENALISKTIRNSGLRIIPADFVEEAVEIIKATIRDRAATDPEAEKKALVDAFHAIGISPSDLAEYLGHDLDKIQPAEMVDMRTLYQAIRDGEATWNEALESRGKPPKEGGGKGSEIEDLKDRQRKKRAKPGEEDTV
ncbi:hypothetical protein LCGC14_3052560, partial [marine sediment metagenome]